MLATRSCNVNPYMAILAGEYGAQTVILTLCCQDSKILDACWPVVNVDLLGVTYHSAKRGDRCQDVSLAISLDVSPDMSQIEFRHCCEPQ